jgi:hypothetical protein
MLQYKSLNRIFRILYTRKVHHVIPYSYQKKRVQLCVHLQSALLFSAIF